MEGQQLPAQQVTKLCRWATHGQYPQEACAYTGTDLFTKKNELMDNRLPVAFSKLHFAIHAKLASANLHDGRGDAYESARIS